MASDDQFPPDSPRRYSILGGLLLLAVLGWIALAVYVVVQGLAS